MSNFRICIQNLSAYNGGRLIFEWLDLPASEDEIHAAQSRILEKGGGEELMLADSEGFPFKVGEYDSLARLNEWAEALDGEDVEMIEAYCGNIHITADSDPRNTIQDAKDAFVGEFRSRAEFAEETYLSVYEREIPDFLRNHIDWYSVGSELLNDHWEINGYYFRNH